MRVKLLRDTRITAKAGETVEVSSAVGSFLLSVGSAVVAAEEAKTETPKKAPAKKTTTKKTTTKK